LIGRELNHRANINGFIIHQKFANYRCPRFRRESDPIFQNPEMQFALQNFRIHRARIGGFGKVHPPFPRGRRHGRGEGGEVLDQRYLEEEKEEITMVGVEGLKP
jgi:hypothetical protein